MKSNSLARSKSHEHEQTTLTYINNAREETRADTAHAEMKKVKR